MTTASLFRKEQELYEEIMSAWHSLGFYRPLRDDETLQLAYQLCTHFYRSSKESLQVSDLYWQLFERLVGYSELSKGVLIGDSWQNYLLDRLLEIETPFSLKASLDEPTGLALRSALAMEYHSLQKLFNLSATWWQQEAEKILGRPLPLWSDLEALPSSQEDWLRTGYLQMKDHLAKAEDWSMELPALGAYYKQYGSGLFSRYLAFRWEGTLIGIEEPDPIRLENLVGYKKQRQWIVENTERLLQGYRANNILLYGDRGTGKSSTVKALLHRFGQAGLRLIEVPKSRLGDFPAIIEATRKSKVPVILFVDDLSFEDGESGYQEMKALLEGAVAVRPDHMVIYATSNRRHLIKEKAKDSLATMQEEELRPGDSYQEKMSLADRFGITVTFLAPNQEEYLQIVDALAAERSLHISKEELHRRALLWERRQNGRSGRTARQFIDSIT
ncbi:ATP-binding protein [Heliorestis convoluta]|uniref:ATP-binding protein n=1 Tax=Heliorestis convoluta TaxID=356322 RepID=A0A5Q2MXN7_9FIRM|nr:ATP-binding protein [Heliorestis convoluta]QGG47534.1 ATP-binding protein [Heliorestis convoluta]